MSIPELDIRQAEGDSAAFAKALGEAYARWGFVGIRGHGIDPSLIDQALAEAAAVFALPDSRKLTCAGIQGGARGYVPLGREIARDASVHDLKEFWHVGREVDGEPRYPQLLPNVWPPECPQFRPVMLALYDELEQLGRRILSALALYLQLPGDWFETRVDQGNSILRVLHYPPLPDNVPAGSLRAAAHEDINLITLLVGSRQSGLEILNRRGEWVGVSMVPGTIVVNIGDMLQRLTNGMLPSTTHRVLNPDGAEARQSRYSLPFFLHPNPDMDLDVLPQCVSADNPRRYPPITAHEFLEQRLREIGLL